MEQRIETREPRLALAYRLQGAYSTLDYNQAWEAMGLCCQENQIGCCGCDVEYLSTYLDNPDTTPAADCRCDVCIAALTEPIANTLRGMRLDHGVRLTTLPGGRWMVFTHRGPYSGLAAAYAEIYRDIVPTLDVDTDHPAPLEKYITDPFSTAPEDLITEIWIAIR
ncbi:MAG: GyrI-like domain-containing protein [Paludibacteraceae bacterium]